MNKVMLIGNAGGEPKLEYTPTTGTARARFGLATNRRWKDKATGDPKEETTWFNIVAWDRLAETCSQYIHKGDKVYVEGRFTSRKYSDKDGVERTAFEVIMTDMELLSPKGGGPSASDSPGAPAGAGELGNDEEDYPF
ncbi:MAG TPA: single-stranded DNA-binding protein [Ktedonobacterales bacterium]|nr:single-stranded DNA-binding protein [Ktedonobacterales bacterium]